MITVVHCRKAPYDVYIGRAHQELPESKWANPFRIGKDGIREEVIAKYEAYLKGRPDLMAALPELRHKVLGCWCAPEHCHGHVLAGLVNKLIITEYVEDVTEQAKRMSPEAKEALGSVMTEVALTRIEPAPVIAKHMLTCDIAPIFSSTASLAAQSILTLEEAGKTRPGNAVSICDLARESHLKQVTLVDDRIDGFLDALRNLAKPFKPTPPLSVDAILKADENSKTKLTRAEAQRLHEEATTKYAREKDWSTEPIQLVFGLKLIVVPDMAQKDPASAVQESTVIVFMRDVVHDPKVQSPAYTDLVRLNNRAWTEGLYKDRGRVDWRTLRELWTPNLALALPFFSSFLSRNQLTFATIVPDLPCQPTVFREVGSELPFAHIIDAAIDRYAAETGCPVQRVKSIYYAGTGRSTMEDYTIMRARENHGTISSPKADNLASDRFSWAAFKELTC